MPILFKEDGSAVCAKCKATARQIAPMLWKCERCHSGKGPQKASGEITVAAAHHESGPGTELKAILKDWLGIESSPACSCNRMAQKMNKKGVEWCLSDVGMAEILGVMRAEHAKRWADGRTRLPWTDFGAKRLVRLACRRARAKASA